MERIGKVLLNDHFYTGNDVYCDGEIEDILLEIVKKNEQEQFLYKSNEWAVLYHLSNMRENLLDWYPFEENAEILEVGAGCGALTGLLSRKAKKVTCIELSKKRSMINAYRNIECDNVEIIIGNFKDIKLEKKFDYITLIGVWEYSGLYVGGEEPFINMLQSVKEFLKEDGRIIVAIENKMGLKYWNGAREDHTGKFYSGMNDYVSDKNVRTFSKLEIIKILEKTKIEEYKFYYPVLDYKLPSAIYSDEYLPQPGNIRCYGQEYSMDRVYNFYDATAFDQICNDQMFTYFSNSFLFICGNKKLKSKKIMFVKYARERCEQFRIGTLIEEQNGKIVVVKKALNKNAKEHILNMKRHEEMWQDSLHGLSYVKGYVCDDRYIVPFIGGIALDTYLYMWRNNADKFISQFISLCELYLKPDDSKMISFKKTKEFEEIFGKEAPQDCKSLRITNIDLTFSNLKMTKDQKVYNYDYEWIFDFEIPYEYVIWRASWYLYEEYKVYLNKNISLMDYMKKIGININNLAIYQNMEEHFTNYVHGINGKEFYLNRYKTKILLTPNKFNYFVDFLKKLEE